MNMVKTATIVAGAAFALIGAATLSVAQTTVIGTALNAGDIGESVDGYLAVRSSISEAVRKEVDQMNIRRRDLYTQKAQEKGATIQEVAKAFGCEKVEQNLAVGRWYAAPDKSWHQKAASDVIRFDGYCPR
jgi:uncharacterized protein YdbL (DUF1318 family)